MNWQSNPNSFENEEIFIRMLLCGYECSCTIVAYFIILSALRKAR